MRILGLIPARGGSKGIPGKNLVSVCGKPLIAYSLDVGMQLLGLSSISELIVSTDHEDIAAYCMGYGINVPFMRPAEISTDTSKTIDVILNAVYWYRNKGVEFDAVLLLQPTSPLREAHEVESALELFKAGKSESLISVYKEEYINDLVMYRYKEKGSSVGSPLNQMHNRGVRRQDHGHVYVRNGSIYITAVRLLEEGVIISDDPLLFEMQKSRSINIDTPEDLKLLKDYLCG
jgi:CMP-N-acetylneuraminic acid synthetase